jgi:hypothetical protein
METGTTLLPIPLLMLYSILVVLWRLEEEGAQDGSRDDKEYTCPEPRGGGLRGVGIA